MINSYLVSCHSPDRESGLSFILGVGMRTPEEYEQLRQKLESDMQLRFSLEQYGDHLQDQHGYIDFGMKAIAYYLFQKYHWPLSTIKTMPLSDLVKVLEPDFSNWLMNKTN